MEVICLENEAFFSRLLVFSKIWAEPDQQLKAILILSAFIFSFMHSGLINFFCPWSASSPTIRVYDYLQYSSYSEWWTWNILHSKCKTWQRNSNNIARVMKPYAITLRAELLCIEFLLCVSTALHLDGFVFAPRNVSLMMVGEDAD